MPEIRAVIFVFFGSIIKVCYFCCGVALVTIDLFPITIQQIFMVTKVMFYAKDSTGKLSSVP